eukprot:CAMPEP_0118922342 /NCGR_PEP_ID=MMETSP1169-20130426/1295_1 /TAXON_ID=36882 /ORGANISM="Pyramimonas obovata, Strain CCMP722" /LENGTH=256 /DNA_ID=CAMNT_0006863189 /DNA_START=445 /DNA_END=1215 /DNA_ORIENTATION=+
MAAHADLTEEEVWAMEEEDDVINESRSSASSENGDDRMDKDVLEDGMMEDYVSLGQPGTTGAFPICSTRPTGWQDDGFDLPPGVGHRRGSLPTAQYPPLASSLPIAVPHFISNSIPSRSGSDSLERPTTPTASTFDNRAATFVPRGQSPMGDSPQARGIHDFSRSYQPVPFGGKRMPFSPDSEDSGDFVPPHMLSSLPRGLSSSVTCGPGLPRYQLSSTCPHPSYLEESIVGRPGKGRDAIKIRNAIFKQTGFTAV